LELEAIKFRSLELELTKLGGYATLTVTFGGWQKKYKCSEFSFMMLTGFYQQLFKIQVLKVKTIFLW